MAKIRLTDRYVATVTVPAGQRLEVYDQHQLSSGLMLRVTDKAAKTWVLRYRTDDGEHRRMTLGRYPSLSLAEARTKAAEESQKVRDGKDPAGDRRRTKAEAKAQPVKTLDDLVGAYFPAVESGEWKPRGRRKRASTLKTERYLWSRHIKPALGDLKLEDVTPAAIKRLLRALVAKGQDATSNRVRGQLSQMFAFAVSERRLKLNPVAETKKLGTETPRERVLKDEEIRAVWRALDAPAGLRKPVKGTERSVAVTATEPITIALKLLLLTLTRRAEVAEMTTDELDLERKVWTVPGARTKNHKALVVPLSDPAVELIERALVIGARHRGDGNKVFPSSRRPGAATAPAYLSHTLHDVRLALGLQQLGPHDLRRTAATAMVSRLEVQPFLVGRMLNHSTELAGVAAVTLSTYALHDFASEKRRALDAWAHLLLQIVHGAPVASNVVPMPRAEQATG